MVKETIATPEVKTYYFAAGRRKEAAARVRLYILSAEEEVQFGKIAVKRGEIVVNERPVENYFPGETYKKMYLEPLRTTNTLDRFTITARIIGGGPRGQLDAFIHGLSRALEKIDKEKNRPTLKKKGLLTRDPRIKQRRKAGYAQKSRARKQSPKR